MSAQLVAVPLADLSQLVARASQRWLPIDHAASYCGCSAKSLRRATAKGELTPSRAVRGRLLYDRRQLDAWLTAGME